MTVELFEMPTIWVELKTKGRGGKVKRRRKINYIQLAALLGKLRLKGVSVVWIEEVHAMPTDGPVGAFTFGESVGAVKGICTANKFAVYEVRPQVWKKMFALLGREKTDSMIEAGLIFGSDQFVLVKDHNKADAALIACYGARYDKEE